MKQIIVICLSFFLTLPVLAQEETPEPFTRVDNECYVGGTMEGHCDEDIDGDGVVSQAEIDWAWSCGWYIARFNDGTFTRDEVAVWCSSLLPTTDEQAENASDLNTCMNVVYGYSIRYIGPKNVLGNTLFYPNLNCSGTSDDVIVFIIFASSQAEAKAICDSYSFYMDTDGHLSNYVANGTNVPSNAYYCTGA